MAEAYGFVTKTEADAFRTRAKGKGWLVLTKAAYKNVYKRALKVKAAVLGRQSGPQSQLGGPITTMRPRPKKESKRRSTAGEYVLPDGRHVNKEAFEEYMRAIQLEEEMRYFQERQDLAEGAITPAQRRARKGVETRQTKKAGTLAGGLSDDDIERVMKKRLAKPRGITAVNRDLKTTAKITFKRNSPRAYLWALHPERYDLQNVDTKDATWVYRHMTPEQRATLTPEEREKWISLDRERIKKQMQRENVKRVGKYMPGGGPPRAMTAAAQQKQREYERIGGRGWRYTSEAKRLVDWAVNRGYVFDDIDSALDNIDTSLTYDEKKAQLLDYLTGRMARVPKLSAMPRAKAKAKAKRKLKGSRGKRDAKTH